MHSVAIGGGREQGVPKLRSYGRSKARGWGWRGETRGRRLVAQLLTEWCWPPKTTQIAHIDAEGSAAQPGAHPALVGTFQPSRPCTAEAPGNGSCCRDASRAALRGSGRGFAPHRGTRGEPVLGGACILHGGMTIRAELSVTVTLLGRWYGTGQTTTTSAPACPAFPACHACSACSACSEGASWEHQAL